MKRIWIYVFILIFGVAFCCSHPAYATYDSTDTALENTITPEGQGHYDYYLSNEPQSDIIPFSKAGNLIVIQATVNNVSGNFILDTGAPGLILNITYFRQLKKATSLAGEVGGITGSVEMYERAVVDSFSLGQFLYQKVQSDRVNLGHIENSKGIRILGLLGVALFKRFEMIIDYQSNQIFLHKMGKKEPKDTFHPDLDQKELYNSIPLTIRDGKIMVEMRAGKNKLNFVLDTGAESNVLDSRLSKKVFQSVTLDRRVTLIGSGNNKMDAWYGLVENLSMGNTSFENTEVLITSLESMALAYGRNIDGMLGNSLLGKQKIGINFCSNMLYIWK
jgi:predicted aspartyl protease